MTKGVAFPLLGTPIIINNFDEIKYLGIDTYVYVCETKQWYFKSWNTEPIKQDRVPAEYRAYILLME